MWGAVGPSLAHIRAPWHSLSECRRLVLLQPLIVCPSRSHSGGGDDMVAETTRHLANAALTSRGGTRSRTRGSGCHPSGALTERASSRREDLQNEAVAPVSADAVAAEGAPEDEDGMQRLRPQLPLQRRPWVGRTGRPHFLPPSSKPIAPLRFVTSSMMHVDEHTIDASIQVGGVSTVT
eukprot:1388699-Prymnesium_polylepis.1